jgi:hypothetical protein
MLAQKGNPGSGASGALDIGGGFETADSLKSPRCEKQAAKWLSAPSLGAGARNATVAGRSHPLTRAQYARLSPDSQRFVDCLRRHLAQRLAKECGMPLEDALQSVIALHERGDLNLVSRGGRIELEPGLGALVSAGGRL